MHPSITRSFLTPYTGDSVRTAVLKCGGGAVPSRLDAATWQRMCTAFKGRSHDLCNAVALLAKRICTEEISTASMPALTACRLIAPDKNPGVRPFGVAEVLRRIDIVGKVTRSAVKPNILQAVGPPSYAQAKMVAVKQRSTPCG